MRDENITPPITATHPRLQEDVPAPPQPGDGPLPRAFTADEIAADPILQYFTFAHLPAHLQSVSGIYAAAALETIAVCARSAERTVALRKLLEAKDAAVRAVVAAQV